MCYVFKAVVHTRLASSRRPAGAMLLRQLFTGGLPPHGGLPPEVHWRLDGAMFVGQFLTGFLPPEAH